MFDLLDESYRHYEGEEDSEDGRVGLQVDADRADVENERDDLAVEEAPLDDNSNDSEASV